MIDQFSDVSTCGASTSHNESSYPLLPLQHGMLLNLLADPTSDIDRNQIVVTVPERLRTDLFRKAWQRVLERHPVLRTSFHCGVAEEPRQRVHAAVTADVVAENWAHASADEREVRFSTFLAADRHRVIDLRTAPLWRVSVFDHGNDGYRFVFSAPHALMDGQSLYLVMEEFFDFYSAFVEGADLVRPVPPPFERFVTWVGGLDRSAAQRHWNEALRNLPERPALLIPPPENPAAGHGHASLELSPDLTQRVRSLAKANRATVALVAKAAWGLLLGRLTGAADVVFGEIRHGRVGTVPNASSMIGLFINTVPVRLHLREDTTVEDLIRAVKDDHSTTRPFEHTGLSDIQRAAGGPAGTSLFETLFIFDHCSFETPLRKKGGAWEHRRFANHERTSVPITLNVHAEPLLSVSVAYDRSRFGDAFMTRMLASFGEILDGFTQDTAQRVRAMNILPAPQQQRFQDWNRTARPIDASATIPSLFDAQVAATPDRTAIVFEDVSLSYRALAERVDRMARTLQSMGVGPDVLVGICLGRSEQLVVALLAVMKAGGAYVPLDPEFPQDRTRLMVADAQPLVIVTTAEYEERFTGCGPAVMCLDDGAASQARMDAGLPLASTAGPEHLAYVIYTSGSTGRPKGVMLTHTNVVNCFVGMDGVLRSPDRGTWLAVTSISFDISVLELFYTLTRGFTIVVAPDPASRHAVSTSRSEPRSAPPSVGELITRHRVTHLQCTPSLIKMMLADPTTSDALGFLHALMLGGEALPDEVLRRLGSVPTRRILNMYGPTETTIWSTSAEVDPGNPRILIGRPIANTETYIVDEQLSPTPAGVPGELLIGGYGVARGYLNREDLTASRFVPDPFVAGADRRVYRTGDLVRQREDGALEYLGRLDHQVKLHGHRIELGEIESVMQTSGGVADAAVVVRTDLGAEPRLVGYYIATSQPTDVADLRQVLSERLPSYMVPQQFVALEAFPLTPNGKLDRKALPRPTEATAGRSAGIVAPRTPTELTLAGIWRDLLGAAQIGVHDSFFDLGGESVTVVYLSQSIRNEFGVETSLADLFTHPTLEEMARLIARAGTDIAPATTGAWATVQTHRPDKSGVPLIGIHGVEQIFSKLIRNLPAYRPFHTITSHVGFDGRSRPYAPCTSVEEMAAEYERELRRIQPTGPYALTGFCLGGLVAMEVARRLTAAGDTVAFLGIINALPQTQAGATRSVSQKARRVRDLGPLGVYRAMRRAAAGVVRGLTQSLPYKVYPTLVRAGYQVSPEWLLAQVGRFGFEMVSRYRPLPYAGKVWLFHGTHGPADLLERWSALALGGLETHRFETNHFGIMAEPHVSTLASTVNRCLASALLEAAEGGVPVRTEAARTWVVGDRRNATVRPPVLVGGFAPARY